MDNSELQPCGTYGAYQRHRRKKEPVDEACRAANRDRARERRTDPELCAEDTARNAARIRALRRLAHEYPERYRQLATEELSKLTFPELSGSPSLEEA